MEVYLGLEGILHAYNILFKQHDIQKPKFSLISMNFTNLKPPNMKSFIAVCTLLSLATSAPTPSNALPTVQLLTLGPDNTHYTSSTQTPAYNGGHIITLVIGTSLSSLEPEPLLLQGIEILGVEGGALDDVICKASLNHSSEGVEVSVRDGMVMLDKIRSSVVQVTGLSCEFGEKPTRKARS